MLKHTVFALLIAAIAAPVTAQSLETASANSTFVQRNFEYLKSKEVVSVYASTKPYCPTFYWWSSRHSSTDNARRNFTSDLARRMQSAGFPQSAIDHCVRNSDFLLKNGELTSHPKNKRYNDLVHAAVMMVRNTSSGAVATTPVLIETNSFDNRQWRVFDQRFKRICTLGDGNRDALPMTCGGYGKLVGKYISQPNNRKALVLRSNRYQMLIMTERPVSYVKRQFAQMFK